MQFSSEFLHYLSHKVVSHIDYKASFWFISKSLMKYAFFMDCLEDLLANYMISPDDFEEIHIQLLHELIEFVQEHQTSIKKFYPVLKDSIRDLTMNPYPSECVEHLHYETDIGFKFYANLKVVLEDDLNINFALIPTKYER